MSHENNRKTWAQPWSYREGTIVTVVGFVGDNLVAFHNPFNG